MGSELSRVLPFSRWQTLWFSKYWRTRTCARSAHRRILTIWLENCPATVGKRKMEESWMLAMCLEKWPVTQGKRKMEANLADLTEDAGLNLKGAMLVMEPFAKMVTR